MNYGKLLSRAWQITWRWKILWLLGLLVALSSGGGSGTANYNFQGGRDRGMVQIPPELAGRLVAIALVVAALAVLIGLALWLIGIIARGGLIAGVQQVEDQGSTAFRPAWRVGVKRFWTLLGIHALLYIVPGVALALSVGIPLVLFLAGGIGVGASTESPGIVAGTVLAALCCIIPVVCGAVIVFVILYLLVLYAERAAVLEGLGALEAIKRGWQVLRANPGPTVLLWLIFLAIGLGVGLVSVALFAVIAGPVVAILLATQPALWWIAPIAIGGLLLLAIGLFIRSVQETFTSTTWTLAYRQMTGMEAQAAAPAQP